MSRPAGSDVKTGAAFINTKSLEGDTHYGIHGTEF